MAFTLDTSILCNLFAYQLVRCLHVDSLRGKDATISRVISANVPENGCNSWATLLTNEERREFAKGKNLLHATLVLTKIAGIVINNNPFYAHMNLLTNCGKSSWAAKMKSRVELRYDPTETSTMVSRSNVETRSRTS